MLAVLVFIVAIVWASVCKVDIIVEANGKLISSSPNIVMKPLERTVIKKVNVKVGQFVKKGQVLIMFDPTFNQAEEERLQEQLSSMTSQFKRLKAEFLGKNFPEGKALTENDAWQEAVFQKRQKFYNEKNRYFTQNIKRVEAAIQTTNESHEKLQDRLKTLKRIEDMLAGLHRKNAIS